jgi:signal transduction histidine kinase
MSAQESTSSLREPSPGLRPPSPGGRGPEIGNLQEAFQVFNKASETLQQSYAELQLETRRLSLELAAANAELQRAQRLQAMGEMAVQLAHEIRNPLGSIELFASMLASRLRSRPDLVNLTEQIVTGVQYLNTIVTNMLTFTKVSRPQFTTFDLNQMIDETLLFFEPVCRQRNVRASRRGTSQAVAIEADVDMLRQMLINLMMNGLQAMPEQGQLIVRSRVRDSQAAVLDVEDTGIGISEENLSKIFDPFFTTNEKGTGLGLSLVHQIVQKHNGTITAESRFGRGTRFHITLPLTQNRETPVPDGPQEIPC